MKLSTRNRPGSASALKSPASSSASRFDITPWSTRGQHATIAMGAY